MIKYSSQASHNFLTDYHFFFQMFRRRVREPRANILRPLQREVQLQGSLRCHWHPVALIHHEIAQIPRSKIPNYLRGARAKPGQALDRLSAILIEIPKKTYGRVHGKIETVVAHFSRYCAYIFSTRRIKSFFWLLGRSKKKNNEPRRLYKRWTREKNIESNRVKRI